MIDATILTLNSIHAGNSLSSDLSATGITRKRRITRSHRYRRCILPCLLLQQITPRLRPAVSASALCEPSSTPLDAFVSVPCPARSSYIWEVARNEPTNHSVWSTQAPCTPYGGRRMRTNFVLTILYDVRCRRQQPGAFAFTRSSMLCRPGPVPGHHAPGRATLLTCWPRGWTGLVRPLVRLSSGRPDLNLEAARLKPRWMYATRCVTLGSEQSPMPSSISCVYSVLRSLYRWQQPAMKHRIAWPTTPWKHISESLRHVIGAVEIGASSSDYAFLGTLARIEGC